nr:hypothetical protein Iba_chr15dCG2740 [Ipomoea batatas]
MLEHLERKHGIKSNPQPYNIEDPSMEVNHTVKSAPQEVVLTSDTRQRTGDSSNSFLTDPVPSCPCLFQPKEKDCPSLVTTTVWLLPDPALIILCLKNSETTVGLSRVILSP